jgi:hypothetical protein
LRSCEAIKFVWKVGTLLPIHTASRDKGSLVAVDRTVPARCVPRHQSGDGLAVWVSLIPIAIGHIVAIALAVGLAALAGMIFPLLYLKISVALLLIGFGVYRIMGRGHVRWGGMQVGFKDLAIWSFLMASAHGAGLMLLPIVIGMGGSHEGHAQHAATFGSAGMRTQLLAVSLHTFGYLLLTGVAAWVVYAKFGVALLRSA